MLRHRLHHAPLGFLVSLLALGCSEPAESETADQSGGANAAAEPTVPADALGGTTAMAVTPPPVDSLAGVPAVVPESAGFIDDPSTQQAAAEPPPLTDETACAGVELTPEEVEVEVPMDIVVTTEVPVPIAFYIVLDNSLSMDQAAAVPAVVETPTAGDAGAPQPLPPQQGQGQPGGVTRWQVAVDSLTEFARAPESDGISVAIQYFNPAGQGTNAAPEFGDVPDLCDGSWHATPDVALGQLPAAADAIVASLEQAEPTGYTPTVGALSGGIAFCEQFQAANPEEDCVVVLVTDGLPRGCGLAPGNVDVTFYDPASMDAIVPIAQAGLAAGVRAFTVGMDGVTPDGFGLLDAIAAAGGTDCTPPDPGGESCNVSASGSVGLLEALISIRDSVTVTETITEVTTVIEKTKLECQWLLPEATEDQMVDPNRVNVTLAVAGGMPEFIGAVESAAECATTGGLGWYYDNPEAPTTILTCEGSCATIQNAVDPVVEVLLGCEKKPQRMAL